MDGLKLGKFEDVNGGKWEFVRELKE